MARDYQSAKRTALGLQAAATARRTGALQIMQLGGQDLMSELPMQYFERGLLVPSELMAQKAALSLFDEYPPDCEAAMRTADEMIDLMQKADATALARLLDANPCAEWLSCVFLDEAKLELISRVIGTAGGEAKALLCERLRAERERLVNYFDLLDALIQQASA